MNHIRRIIVEYVLGSMAALLLCFIAANTYAALPANEMPMYGGITKTDEMKKADGAFISEIEKAGYSKESGAKTLVQKGWDFFGKRDFSNAIKRFNQAWLLDPQNGDVYHGFALIAHQRDNSLSDAEKYFRIALSKPTVSANAYVDYGRLLWLQNRYDESLTQLTKAIKISPRAYNAYSNISFVYYKKGDFVQACKWAKDAKTNNDQLEPGYLEEMCRRAGAK